MTIESVKPMGEITGTIEKLWEETLANDMNPNSESLKYIHELARQEYKDAFQNKQLGIHNESARFTNSKNLIITHLNDESAEGLRIFQGSWESDDTKWKFAVLYFDSTGYQRLESLAIRKDNVTLSIDTEHEIGKYTPPGTLPKLARLD